MRVLSGLVVVLAFAAGCAGTAKDNAPSQTGAPGAPAASSSQAQTKEQQDAARVENLIADCMKAQGFTYIAQPVIISDDQNAKAGAGDPSQVPYEQLKTYRQKYGYGIYGRDVFPNDPAVGNRLTVPDPNNAIRDGLDPARKAAYNKALHGDAAGLKAGGKPPPTGPVDHGCSGKAAEQVYPPSTAKPDPAKQADYQKLLQQFQTDPELVKASQAYGACLRQKGYPVASTKPGVIEMTVQQLILKERSDLPEKIDAARAQQGLQTEITKSVEDLDCGRDYERLAQPFVHKLLTSEGGNG
jgi:hypothetical protein